VRVLAASAHVLRPVHLPGSQHRRCVGRCGQADGVLESWANGTDPCADAWYGISCNCSDIGPFVTEVRSAADCHRVTNTSACDPHAES